MSEQKQYTLPELKKKLTKKERIFCHEYIIDWNGSRAALKAGYSENTKAEIAYENLRKPHIEQYISYIQKDIEKEAGISKLKVLNEHAKIAFSSIAGLHNTWIDKKDFEKLTDDQKACIKSIETKVVKRNDGTKEELEIVNIEMVKVELHPKQTSLDAINKMLGYYAAEKLDIKTDGFKVFVPDDDTASEIDKLDNESN